MTTWRLFPSGSGPALIADTGDFLAGTSFWVTSSGKWLQGYWWWVPSGGDTGAQKFSLWQLTDSTNTSVPVPGSTVMSGTLTAGAWNFVPLAAPVGLSVRLPYVAATGWVMTHGFPDSQNQFGAGQPFAAGITQGPLFAFSDLGGSAPNPFFIAQGLFGTSSADPAAVMPAGGDNSSFFGVDIQVTDVAPDGASFSLFPSQPFPVGAVDDTADNFTLGVEFTLSVPCSLGAIRFYSKAGYTQLPTDCGIFSVATQLPVPGTHNASPSWSGAAGSGIVRCPYSGVVLQPGDYKAAVLNAAGSPNVWNTATNHYWDTGPGSNGVSNGPLSAPSQSAATSPGQSTFHAGSAFTYPATSSGTAPNYWVDVEVTPASTPASSGLLLSMLP